MSGRVFRLLRNGFAAALTFFLAACGSTPLPKYETPLARTRQQTVRTTAYTHTESDHLAYGNQNALGGTLRAAGPPTPSPDITMTPGDFEDAPPRAIRIANLSVADDDEARRAAFLRARAAGTVPVMPATPAGSPRSAPPGSVGGSAVSVPSTAVYGSAAADWSRWPVGTTVRVQSTGQLYRVDDYGFALSGRNTIDLYMPSKSTMNLWGVRTVSIEILKWGDEQESLRILRPRQSYRHIRRMVLELEGNPKAAARVK